MLDDETESESRNASQELPTHVSRQLSRCWSFALITQPDYSSQGIAGLDGRACKKPLQHAPLFFPLQAIFQTEPQENQAGDAAMQHDE